MPSSSDRSGGFCIANPSARPITMQLVMIRPTNTDSSSDSSYSVAFRIWSNTMTSEAMIDSCTMMRMLPGV